MFKLSKPYVGRHAYGKTVDSTYLRSVNVELHKCHSPIGAFASQMRSGT